ncbi:MAG: ABC transporter permease, partial [Actinobacteria bacterium]|nr:ABC transporter permease [Actinomycetota bacterium]
MEAAGADKAAPASEAPADGIAPTRRRPRSLTALRTITSVELKLVLREPLTLVFSFAFPVVLLFVMGEVFGQSTGDPGEVVFRGFGAMDYYVPGYLALVAVAFATISLPTHLAAYRERGVLRRLHASGVRGRQILASQTLVGIALTTVGAVLVSVLGMLVYHVSSPAAPTAVILIYLLSTLCFMTLGCLLGALIPKARAAQGIG